MSDPRTSRTDIWPPFDEVPVNPARVPRHTFQRIPSRVEAGCSGAPSAWRNGDREIGLAEPPAHDVLLQAAGLDRGVFLAVLADFVEGQGPEFDAAEAGVA